MISAYPKIFAIGTDYIANIFQSEVEITEKIDGSQFDFGKIDGDLYMRSKGKMLYQENPEKMFLEAMEYVQSIRSNIPDNTIFYTEYLQKPKHNNLAYENTPRNHLYLFGISDSLQNFFPNELNDYAKLLDIDPAELLYKGKISDVSEIHALLEHESYLGGPKIEGIVVKNYNQPFLLGNRPIPLMAGKYVSEAYKEKAKQWSMKFTGKGKWETFKMQFRTEARWHKAIQHLRDNGELENSPRDIGNLIKEIQRDITEEEQENIKKFLWHEFGIEILRYAARGFPEWYKEKLLEKAFQNETRIS